MKTGWPRKKISEIARHSLGKMLDKAKNKGQPQPYLRNLNVRWFDFDLSDVLEMRFLPEEADRYTAIRGDVLVCEGGYPGRAAIWDQEEPIYFQKALHRVRFYEPERNKWFLYYLHFCDLEGTLSYHFNGAGIQHFTGEALARFELPCPPIPEQQRIVAILDEAFDGIATARANAEQNLRKARALFESHLQSVFTEWGEGWVETTLEKCCEQIFAGGDVPKDRLSQERTAKYNVPIFSNGTKDEGLYGFTDVARVTKPSVTVSARGTIGFSAIRTDPFFPVVRLIVLTPDNNLIHLSFLHYVVLGMDFGNTGTSIPQLTVPNFKGSKLFLPPVSQQRDIVTKLDALRKETQRLESLYQSKLEALDELKQSLLHQAFSGQL